MKYRLAAVAAWMLFFFGAAEGAEIAVTDTDVYIEAEQVSKEVILLKKALKIEGEKASPEYQAVLKPKHTWQKTYIILLKINIFRKRHGMPAFAINSMEPLPSIDPWLTYEQIMRIHNELQIVKTRLGILEQTSFPELEDEKGSVDVFNKLHYISAQIDLLNGEEVTPNYVFAEAIRIYEDVSTILRNLNLEDTTYPPEKREDATAADSLDAVFLLMEEIQRLQRGAGIERTNFIPFRVKEEEATSSEVLNMLVMCVAELQTLKAHLGVGEVTPPAELHHGKSPADVHQVVRWITRQLRLIQALR